MSVIMSYLEKEHQNLREYKLKMDQFQYENQILTEENKRLVNDYEVQGQVLNSYKLKVEGLKISHQQIEDESPKKLSEIAQLNRKIDELSEEIDNKNIEIDELYAIL